jgi:hypothetical protein
MDVAIAAIVGTTLMGGMGLLAYHILRDLRHMKESEAYFHEQRRLMRRLEGLQFDRDHFFDQVDQYRSAFDGR